MSVDSVITELRAIRSLLASQQAELLGSKAAARYLGISVASLYRLAASNSALRPVKIGQGSKRWRRADLQKYVSELGK